MSTRTWGTAVVAALLVTVATTAATVAGETKSFELSTRQRLAFDGRVVGAADKPAGLEFGVIPTRPPTVGRRLNAWNQFEQHVEPAVEHPIPVLRAAGVRVYADRPDVSRLALDQVRSFDRQAMLDHDPKFAVVADGAGAVRLVAFTRVSVPRDRDDDWRLAGTIEPLTLPEHVDDPVADRGRAVETDKPLPLAGKLVFATREDGPTPTVFHRYDFATGREEKVGGGHSAMMAADGTVIDCPNTPTVDVTDRAGGRLAHLTFDKFGVRQFAISPDGRRFALVVERFENVYAPVFESVVMAYSATGEKLGEIVGYDDPAFFPDGRLLLTAPGIDPGLYVWDVRAAKAELLAVTDGPGDNGKVDWPKNPVVSPDGKWIAYETRQHNVALVGTDGRGWQEVWKNTNQPQAAPAFSPDGRYVAVVALQPDHWHGEGVVTVIDVRKHVRQALPATQGANSGVSLTWMP